MLRSYGELLIAIDPKMGNNETENVAWWILGQTDDVNWVAWEMFKLCKSDLGMDLVWVDINSKDGYISYLRTFLITH